MHPCCALGKPILFRIYLRLQSLARSWGWMRHRVLRKASRWLYKQLKCGDQVSVSCRGLVWSLDAQDSYFTQGVIVAGDYEPWETGFFTALLQEGMTVIDVGAHVGWYTLLAAKAVGPNGRVFAFEPEPMNYQFLARNVAVNRCLNVETVRKAVSDHCGQSTLVLSASNPGGHYLETGRHQPGSIVVHTTTLDVFFEPYPNPIHLLKLDAEGAELLVWRGMRQLLRRHGELRIMMEFSPAPLTRHGGSAEMLLAEYRLAGFVPHRIDEIHRRLIPTDLTDLLRICEQGRNYTNVFLFRDQQGFPKP